jgi:hypothetical protein
VAKNKFYSTTSPYYYLRGDLIPAAYKTDFNNGRILFSTADGTIISINIMTWDKDENGQTIALYYSKAAILVDINGLKGPNTYGKDVFTFSADYKDNKVYPSCIDEPMTSINNNCSKKSYGNCCIAKIIKDGWKIADDYPW